MSEIDKIKELIDAYANERLWYVTFINEKKLKGEFMKFLLEKGKIFKETNIDDNPIR